MLDLRGLKIMIIILDPLAKTKINSYIDNISRIR